MMIQMIVERNGNTTIDYVSILEDLWEDYLHHKATAAASVGKEQRRNLRAALRSIFEYFEGVLNAWAHELESDKASRKRFHNSSVWEKCEIIEGKLPKHEGFGAWKRNKKAKDLRNCIAHLKPNDDLRIYTDITIEMLNDAEGVFNEWMAIVEELSGLRRHPSIKKQSEKLARVLGPEIE